MVWGDAPHAFFIFLTPDAKTLRRHPTCPPNTVDPAFGACRSSGPGAAAAQSNPGYKPALVSCKNRPVSSSFAFPRPGWCLRRPSTALTRVALTPLRATVAARPPRGHRTSPNSPSLNCSLPTDCFKKIPNLAVNSFHIFTYHTSLVRAFQSAEV